MAPRGFDAELAQLDGMRDATPAIAEPALRKALASRNSFIVGKAAALVAQHNLASLVPKMTTAFASFLDEPAKNDQQCWAKEGLAKALAALDYQEPGLFLRGMATFQQGYAGDAATGLRGTCALGLVNCRGLSNVQVLTHLLPLFTDPEVPVQVNAARAIEQIGTEAAALLLRLRAELGSGPPELLGACYSAVLRLDGPGAIPWAAKFLHAAAPDDTSAEAAFAIAETRAPAAFETLKQAYAQTRDPDFRGTLMTALAITRLDAAFDFLLGLVAEGNRAAREALEDSAPPQAILERLARLR